MYSLFQGDQWTTRLEIAFTALFAAVAAGLLVLLIALTLIILKLGFLLLLVAGPFFLIVGVHPGFGRVVAIRWFEMLVGVLLKQVAVALVLSVLLYCYSLIMGTTDQELPWALKIMMISLVTVAVFIYRKPFQHLFSSVGYGMLGTNERAEISWRESAFGFRRVSATAAGTVVPGAAAGAARPRVPLGAPHRGRWRWRAPTGPASGAADGGVRATSSDGMSGDARRPTATAPPGSGRRPASAPAARPRRCRCRPTAPRRPPNGGPAGWARNGAPARAPGSRGPAQPPVRRTGPMPAAPTSAAARAAAGAAGAARRRPHRRGRRPRHRPPPPRRPRRRSGRGPAAGPSSGAGHGTLARPAAAAVRRRRHRARRPWHLRDRGAEPREHRGARHADANADRERGRPRARRERGGDRRPPPATEPAVAAAVADRHDGRRRTSTSGCRSPSRTSPPRRRPRVAFAKDYVTYELHRDQGRLRRQDGRPGTTAQEAATLENDFEHGRRQRRQDRRQAGLHRQRRDRLDQLVRPGPPSPGLVDHVRGHHHAAAGPDVGDDHEHTEQYTVTVVSTATGWQVNDIELACAG